jgi:polynucleotide kinase-phosphatase
VIDIPELSLVVLIGVSGSGKSTFARKHFAPTQVLSSDAFRAMVADDENDQAASGTAFEALHHIAGLRLRAGRLTVVDATNVQSHARAALVKIARDHDVLPVAVVLDVPEEVCWQRTQDRPDRTFGRPVITRQHRDLRRSLGQLAREGFRKIHVLRGQSEVDSAEIAYERLFNDRRDLTGPFDIIGDVHGCAGELLALLRRLGYGRRGGRWSHAAGRRAVFLGDLVDRGPRVIDAATIVLDMTADGAALAVPGNHDIDLAALLRGHGRTPGPGTVLSLAQIAAAPADVRRRFRRRFPDWVDRLPSHLLLDGGRLAVAHAGLLAEHVGRDSEAVRDFAVHGATLERVDRYGLPIRVHWATAYRGRPFLVYGHTAVREPDAVGPTLNIDTGCCYGGALTAFRWPERQVVQVRASRVHYRSPRTRGLRVGIRAETRARPTARGGRPLRPVSS